MPQKVTRRALLEESKQRRKSDVKPRQSIFEALRQVGFALLRRSALGRVRVAAVCSMGAILSSCVCVFLCGDMPSCSSGRYLHDP